MKEEELEGAVLEFTLEDVREATAGQIRRECRGLIFDPAEKRILSRRFPKFFNIGEKEETLPDSIDFTQPYIVLEKLDGSMVAPYRCPRTAKIRYASRKGNTNLATDIDKHIAKCSDKNRYDAFCSEWIDKKNCTPIFEWCSRSLPVLLDYATDSLALIALRHMQTGQYVKWDVAVASAQSHNIPVAKLWQSKQSGPRELADLVKEVRETIGLEGCVIRFTQTGVMYKVKTVFWHDLNKGINLGGDERYIWKAVLENKDDDIKPFVTQETRKRLGDFSARLFTALEKSGEELAKNIDNFRATLEEGEDPKIQRRKFAVWVKSQNYARCQTVLVWKLWEGIDILPAAVLVALQYLGSRDGVKAVSEIAPGVSWKKFAA
eukprot:TRINITY_DN1866_c0_g1_i1.p1 TRINITY_DN1866_c0_g1~~TRINITY_DN1866_c0_g1_i1.p1  ORF type:complete len:377 (+),score=69.89 TRINITY_DN1866_c0_g1_i1:53-1183(+)